MSRELYILQSAVEAHIDIHGPLDLLGKAEETEAQSSAGDGVRDIPEPEAAPVNVVVPEATDASAQEEPSAEAGSAYERIARLIPDGSPLHGFSSLAEVEEFVRSTELIELDQTRINPVFGVGNPEADLMVIGDAPGADEARGREAVA